MNPKILIITLILLVIGSRICFCQTNSRNTSNAISSESLLSGELFDQSLTPDFATYFNADWLAGDIQLTNGRIARTEKIKYNGLLDELFWNEPLSKQIIKLDRESILQFHYLNFNGDP